MELPAGALTVVLLALTWYAAAQEDQREVPIIKQINRVNEDGTYTFGYEAADGSFKIETRDVLGNVKGMFGYIDERGDLKRVSYTANNGTGFQATGNIGRDTVTRRPVLVYRGLGSSRGVQHREDEEGSTTPAYGDYLQGRRGYLTTTTTEEPTTRPFRVLVTKRPVVQEAAPQRNPNLIRRQLERDRDDYSARRFRYPQLIPQDPREVYRNQLLEQSNLKPEYSSPRVRYYAPPPVQEEEYQDHVLPPMGLERQRYLPQRYHRPTHTPYEEPYLMQERRYPVGGGFRRPVYDGYDYETFREAMNYLIQYLQYMRRADPYGGGGGYPGDYLRGRGGPPLPPAAQLPHPSYPGRGIGGGIPPIPGYPGGYPGATGLGAAYQPPNLPYINPNVQYSSPESAQSSTNDQLSNLKSRMDQSDQSDNADTRPPTSSLIRMLLARPSTQRPAIRSVQILGTASTAESTSSTTQQTDLMEASS